MSDLKIIPQGKRILIKLNPVAEKKTQGGIILPDSHSEESRIGSVVAKGDKVEGFEIGDKILISFFSGTVLHFPGEGVIDDTVRMITQSEIMGKIE